MENSAHDPRTPPHGVAHRSPEQQAGATSSGFAAVPLHAPMADGPDAAAVIATLRAQVAQQQDALNQLGLQQQQLFQHLQQQQASPSPGVAASSPGAAAALDATAAALQHALLAQQTMQTLEFAPFWGSALANGLTAAKWMQEAETILAMQDGARPAPTHLAGAQALAMALRAMRGPAREWFLALDPRPTDWAAFKTAFAAKYNQLPLGQLAEAALTQFVDKEKANRTRMSAQRLQTYCARFVELASRVDGEMMTLHSKAILFAAPLEERLRGEVWKIDKTPGKLREMGLDGLAAHVQQYALQRDYATHGAAGIMRGTAFSAPSAASSSSRDDMDLSSMQAQRIMEAFNLQSHQLEAYLGPTEGWAPHDTAEEEAEAPASQPGDSGLLLNVISQLANLVPKKKFPPSRRSQAPATKETVPGELAEARREAGLCIRCGVHRYEPGTRGHNSRTCKFPINKTLSAEEGVRRAGTQPLFRAGRP